MVLLLFFLYFSIVQYVRIVVEPLDKNAPHLAISRLRDATSYLFIGLVPTVWVQKIDNFE